MKCYYNLYIIILLFSTIKITISEDDDYFINFDGDYYISYMTTNEDTYLDIFIEEEIEIKNYLKIEVFNSDENKNPNLMLAFSNKDESCLDREQLSFGLNSTQMWLTKNQIENYYGYLYISCSSYPCNYILNLKGSDFIEMEFNSQFNLYITEKNKNVEILFLPDFDNSNYMTIWAIGNKNVEANLELSDFDYKKYSKNNIFYLNTDINESIFELTLSGEVGDVINIGSSSINNNYYNLYINQPEIKGFLEKESNTENCYRFIKNDIYINSQLYLSGLIYSKVAEIYFKNENDIEIEDSNNIIKNGSFIFAIKPNLENYFCIRFPETQSDNYDLNEIFYSLQLTIPSQYENKIMLYSPQVLGEIYPRFLEKGEVYSYTGIFPNDNNNNNHKITFDILSQFGSIEVYYSLCKTYPLCNGNDEKLLMHNVNNHFFQKINYEKYSPMEPNKYILTVKCKNEEGNTCAFKPCFFSDLDRINLKENEFFNQYIFKGEKKFYKIDYSGETSIKEIYIDLMVFTGDVQIYIDNNLQLNANKKYNSNKISYNIKLDQKIDNNEVYFYVLASKNSYYNIKYRFIRESDESSLIEIIESGISYLVTIDPETKNQGSGEEVKPEKIIKFTNLRNVGQEPIICQFYSLNCKFDITTKRINDEGIFIYESLKPFDDHYYQDLALPNNLNDYEYRIFIKETELSKYNNKICMIYASAFPSDSFSSDEYKKQIVINDNEQKEMIFIRHKIEEFEYIYPHSNSSNDVILDFNLLNLAEYQITVAFNNRNNRVYMQSGNDLIYIIHNEWKNICLENEICTISIKIKIKAVFELESKLLFSVKMVQDNIPSYINKNQVILDYSLGNNWNYYYTDLGFKDEGDIIINYRRGCGSLFGKIVPMNRVQPEENANWREIYKFPINNDESLEFDEFTKKIIFTKEETNICQDGCYLLLSLKSSIISQEKYNPDYREHPFSILIHSKSSDKPENIPIINIPIKENIIGNLKSYEDENIYEYYSLNFPYDSNKILIEIQNKNINLYINVGNNIKPTIKLSDFKFENNGEDTIYELSKGDFINKCEEKNIIHENSLSGLSMIIGLWTNKKDSFNNLMYSLKVHLPIDNKLNIYEIKSDQKAICKTEYINNNYRCLFMIFYFGIDALNHLFLYPKIQDHSSYEMYADWIDRDNYEFFDYNYLNSKTPNYESEYSTYKTGLDYIYIENGKRSEQFLYVNIITKTKTIVELLSSFYMNDIQLSPIPNSPQLFLINNDHFLFEFNTKKDLIINIKSICGEGNIYWELDNNVQYTLHGKEDIISLTNSLIDRSDEKIKSKLYINNNSSKLKDKPPGFGFIINYTLRPSQINLDQIQIGKSTKLAYRNTDFPVFIYSQITEIKDTNIFVNLYELIGEKYSQLTNIKPFEISSTLVKESTIINLKSNIELINNLKFDFKGIYDPMIKTGFILIEKKDLSNDNPIILVKISKNKDYPQMKPFTRITLEASIIQDNSIISVVPEKYQYGKLSLNNDINIYKLKTSKTEKYMRIYYSSNSQYITFSFTTLFSGINNSTTLESNNDFINGKWMITLNSNPNNNDYIYLNVFFNEKNSAELEKKANYVFKYMNSDDINNFPIYELLLDNIGLQEIKKGDKYDYIINFMPLLYKDVDITYFIKFGLKNEYIEGEYNSTIALTESGGYTQEIDTFEIINEMIVKKYENIDEIDYKFVQIMAEIKDNRTIDFISYQRLYKNESDDDDKDKDGSDDSDDGDDTDDDSKKNNPEKTNNNVLKIVLGVVGTLIIIILVVFIIICLCKKKKNLSEKISYEFNKNEETSLIEV